MHVIYKRRQRCTVVGTKLIGGACATLQQLILLTVILYGSDEVEKWLHINSLNHVISHFVVCN